MEVRFRPLEPSAMARRLSPGQAPSEQGESFFEVVESLTGAANNPEEHNNSGQKQESANRQRPPIPPTVASPPVGENAKTAKPVTPPADKSEDNPLGVRIDMTA